MKTASCLARLAIVVAVPLAAAPAGARVRPVVEAGLHFSTLDFDHDLADVLDPTWDSGWRPSFTGGAYAEFPLGSRFRLSPGLRYVQKGNRIRLGSGGEYESRLVLHYLAIPVLLQLRPFASPRVAFSLGPEVAYLLSAAAVDISGTTQVRHDDIRDLMDDFDFAIEAGAEYAFPLEDHEGFVRLRYSEGLVGVADASHWISDYSTRGIQTVLGLRW